MTHECALCAENKRPSSELPPREAVYRNKNWRVAVHASALPGWLLVICDRHIESLEDLSVEEARSLGSVFAEGTRALRETVGSVKSYAMLFAESSPHVHFNLIPRMSDIPDHLKGAAVGGYNREGPILSAEERDALALRISEAWKTTEDGD